MPRPQTESDTTCGNGASGHIKMVWPPACVKYTLRPGFLQQVFTLDTSRGTVVVKFTAVKTVLVEGQLYLQSMHHH